MEQKQQNRKNNEDKEEMNLNENPLNTDEEEDNNIEKEAQQHRHRSSRISLKNKKPIEEDHEDKKEEPKVAEKDVTEKANEKEEKVSV